MLKLRGFQSAMEREGARARPPHLPLREDHTKGSKCGKFFTRGSFLTIEEIANDLEHKEVTGKHRNPTTSLKMLQNIRERREDPIMQAIGRSLPFLMVFDLQHVTRKSGFKGIMQGQHFIGGPKNISNTENPMLENFSWWNVVVPRADVTSLKDIAYKELTQHNPQLSGMPTTFILDQFANSPLFDEGSRYGNFKFSFPVEELLAAYSEQHCPPGGTPVFRVLGTWTYQQEILHAVLIHGSQYNDTFRDLPNITRDSKEPIYRLQNGTFQCNLESISNKFTLRIGPEGPEILVDRSVPCVWNNPAFAFYLPDGAGLQMAISEENLAACHLIKPNHVSRADRCYPNKAEELIRKHFTKKRKRRRN